MQYVGIFRYFQKFYITLLFRLPAHDNIDTTNCVDVEKNPNISRSCEKLIAHYQNKKI